MNSVKITIGFPVYNVERFVESSLLSALNQDFLLDYEILVIDDCGNDNSMCVVDRVRTEHPKGDIVRIIRHNGNKGLGAARNTIIENAHGEFLFFLDSDDTLTSDCLSTLYNKAKEHNYDVVIGSIDCLDEEGVLLETHHFADVSAIKSNAGAYLMTQGVGWSFAVCNKLFRLQFLRENSIYCKHSKFEDVYLGFMIYLLSGSCACLSKITFHNTLRKNSITRSTPVDSRLANIFIQIVKDLTNEVKMHNSVDVLYDYYLLYLRRIFLSIDCRSFDSKTKRRINNEICDYMKVIPSIHNLRSRTHQLLWLINRISTNYSLFVKTYKKIEVIRAKIYY